MVEEVPIDTVGLTFVGDQRIASHVVIAPDNIRLRVASWHRHFNIEDGSLLTVHLDDARYATLRSVGRYSVSQSRSTTSRTYSGEYIATSAIIGRLPWTESRQIDDCEFSFAFSDHAIEPHLKQRRYYLDSLDELTTETTGPDSYSGIRYSISVVDRDDLTVCAFETRDVKVHIWAAPSGNSERGHAVVHLSFKRPDIGLSECELYVFEIVRFFSISMGLASRPIGLRVASGKLSVGGDQVPDLYDIRHLWADDKIGEPSTHDIVQFPARTAEQRVCLGDALKRWLDRRGEWQSTYANAFQCVRQRGQISVSRLQAAFAWIEATPTLEGPAPVSLTQVESIIASLSPILKDLNLLESKALIDGHLRHLAAPRTLDRVLTCLNRLRDKLGGDAVPTKLEADCRRAWKLRSRLSHGATFDRQTIAQSLSSAIHTAEYLGLLLLWEDMEGGAPKATHPLARYVRPF